MVTLETLEMKRLERLLKSWPRERASVVVRETQSKEEMPQLPKPIVERASPRQLNNKIAKKRAMLNSLDKEQLYSIPFSKISLKTSAQMGMRSLRWRKIDSKIRRISRKLQL